MVEIFICEDNEKQLDHLTYLIRKLIQQKKYDMKITMSTPNPYELLDYVENNNYNGLYFLDVDLNADISGVELAKKIREYDTNGGIIFVTMHAEYMPLTFEYAIEAMGYISKMEAKKLEKQIKHYLDYVHKRLTDSLSDKDKFVFHNKSKIIIEPYDNIYTFEMSSSKQHKIVMNTTSRRVEFYGALSDIENMTDRFIRCDRTRIVNIDKIREMDTSAGEIELLNGDRFKASVRRMREIKKALGERLNLID